MVTDNRQKCLTVRYLLKDVKITKEETEQWPEGQEQSAKK